MPAINRSRFALFANALKDIATSLLSWPVASSTDRPVMFFDRSNASVAQWIKGSVSLQRFTPCPWARGPWVQTLLGFSTAGVPRIVWHREWVRSDGGDDAPTPAGSPDGGIALDWSAARDDRTIPPTAPILFCTHGLAGSSNSAYLRRLAAAGRGRGYRVVVYNRVVGRTSFPKYVELDETRRAAEAVRRRFPDARAMVAVGFSAGANVFVKYAGTMSDHPFTAVVSIANAHNIRTHGYLLANQPTADALLAAMVGSVLRRTDQPVASRGAANESGERREFPRTIRELDTEVSCRLHGYADVDAYHEAMSSDTAIGGVGVPMLSLASLDDPLVPATQISYAITDAEGAGSHVAVVTARGGHCGFATGPYGRGSWMIDVAMEFADFATGLTATR